VADWVPKGLGQMVSWGSGGRGESETDFASISPSICLGNSFCQLS
jgi:hypothetical protein